MSARGKPYDDFRLIPTNVPSLGSEWRLLEHYHFAYGHITEGYLGKTEGSASMIECRRYEGGDGDTFIQAIE